MSHLAPACTALLTAALLLPACDDADEPPGPTASGGTGGAGATAGTGGTGAQAGAGGDGGAGGAQAVAPPRIHPQDPHRLEWQGATWYPVGYYPAIGTMVSDSTDHVGYHVDLIDRQVEHGINYFRNVMTMGQQYGDSLVPYARTGPEMAADGRPKFDLDELDPSFFEFWREVLSYARANDVVVQLSLLDFWHAHEWLTEDGGDITHEWGLKHDFYQGANNINDIDVATPAEYVDTAHPVFAVQQQLIARAVEELGVFPNIVWEVANEATVFQGDAGTAWQLELADYITTHEQSLGRTPHLVMPRDLPNHEQTPGHLQVPPSQIHGEMVDRFGDGQPLIADNDCCLVPPSADDRRGRAWACLTAGAHLDLFHFPMREQAVLESQDVADGMRYVGMLSSFLDEFSVDLLGMEPADQLVSSGWCYARPTEELLVYLPSGGSTTVSELPSSYTATWFNPRDGSTQSAGDGPTFTAPDGADWALHIR